MEISINNKLLNYVDEGIGNDTVILLHGWGANIATMLPISNLIKDRYRVVLLDLPGFGDSEKPDTVYNSFDYANIVIKFMDKLEIKKATFIGHSFGGKISSIIASKHPELVDKMVLIDSAGLIPKRSLDYYIEVYRYKIGKWIYTNINFKNKEEKLEEFRSKYGSDDYKETTGIMRKILVTVVNENIQPLLKDIKAETLLIWGENDDATPLYMGKIFEKEIPGSGLVVLKNSGHFSYIDDYTTFSAVINSFL